MTNTQTKEVFPVILSTGKTHLATRNRFGWCSLCSGRTVSNGVVPGMEGDLDCKLCAKERNYS